MAYGAVTDQGVSELEDVLCHREPFGAVAVEQRVWRLADDDQGELPAQVVRVHDAGVHALAAGRGVDMHRVAGQQYAAAPVGAGRPAMTAEVGQPGGIGNGDWPRHPLVRQLLDLLQGGSLPAPAARE